MKELVALFTDAFTAHDQFVYIITSPEVVSELLSDYETTATTFSQLFEGYLDHSMFHYYRTHGFQKQMQRFISYGALLETTQKMKQIKTDNPKWFTILGCERMFLHYSHAWTSCPCFFSTQSDSSLAKERYTEIFNQNVVHQQFQLLQDLAKDQSTYRTAYSYHKLFDIRNHSANLWQLATLDPNVGLETPHYFLNEQGFPLPVPKQFLQQIPVEIRLAHELGIGEIVCQWQFSKENDHIVLQARWCLEQSGDTQCELLLEQTTEQLHSYPFAHPLESVRYTWFSGESPTGECASYDAKLGKFSSSSDTQALQEYRRQPNLFTFQAVTIPNLGPTGAHALSCYPITRNASSLYYNDSGVQKVNETMFTQWPITPAPTERITAVKKTIQSAIMGIRQRLMQNAASLLCSGSSQALAEETTLSTEIKEHLIPQYMALSSQAVIAKIALAFADTTWSNLFEGNDLLREIDRYRGQRIHPLHLLKRNPSTLHALKVNLLETLAQRSKTPSPEKMARENFLQEMERDIVPDILAETQCKGLIECETLANSKTFRHLFQQLPMHIREKYSSEGLIGSGSEVSHWLDDQLIPTATA